ncbi:DnaJ-like protein subfamily C member 10 [Aphelenchoides bicaudatus]|nr:DnaJ-like protein subfamily C member 10 [Aphelenchoides bicaudatus]
MAEAGLGSSWNPVWGVTNVFIANSTRQDKAESTDDGSSTFLLWRPIQYLIRLIKNWRFTLPFLINQSASVLFLSYVIKTDLSRAVCTINSLTLVFTVLSGYVIFKEPMDIKRVFFGSLLSSPTLFTWSSRLDLNFGIIIDLSDVYYALISFDYLVGACLKMRWFLNCCVAQLLILLCLAGEDYYKLLDISRDADERTIRRAFKKLAISKHPDKDPDNPDAHSNFIKINRAYEVLKDPDLRRRYDQHGEEGLDENKNSGQQYESWSFYNDKFGIYDDDPEIVTLSRQDFQQKVVDSSDVWFINFYSTFCSHCHDLAPTWREFARKMEGIIRIGAVNCAEDPHLCQSQNVRGYPSLVAFPDHAFFQGHREIDAFVEFITSKLRVELIQITKKNADSLSNQWEPYNSRPWLIDFCDEMENCFKQADKRMLAHMLDKTVNIATVLCHSEAKDKLCDELRTEGLAYYPAGQIDKEHETEINTLDIKEVHKEVLRLLPEIPSLSEDDYRSILDTLEEPRNQELLILFVATKSDANNELKKLAPLIAPSTQFKLADCSLLADGCEGLHLGALPRLVFFRPEGNFLIHYGKTLLLSDVRSFLASAKRSTMISLSESIFDEIRQKQTDPATTEIWLVDMFTPWCNPCLLALNEMKSLPKDLEGRRLRVGILDCETHKQLCHQEGVTSYPTTMLLFGQSHQRLIGFHHVDQIIDFVQETLHPSVVELGPDEFEKFVVQKQTDEIFVVDFFAPWCGPCQQLAPEFRKLARTVQEETDLISFGSVDCDAHRQLCQLNGANRYPTIRVYANGGQWDYPSHFWRNHEDSCQQMLKVDQKLNDLIGDFKKPVIVDFFANWCQHCHIFAPIYDQASRMLDKRLVFAKIDCAEFPNICSKAAISAYPTVKLYVPGRRALNAGIRIHAQDANRLVEVIDRILKEQSYYEYRDEL